MSDNNNKQQSPYPVVVSAEQLMECLMAEYVYWRDAENDSFDTALACGALSNVIAFATIPDFRSEWHPEKSEQKEGWITPDRGQIIRLYKLVLSEKCPGLKDGDEFKKTNEEMLDEIERFVGENVEPIDGSDLDCRSLLRALILAVEGYDIMDKDSANEMYKTLKFVKDSLTNKGD